MKEEYQKLYEEHILSENKITTLEKNLQEKQNKISALKNENELISQKCSENTWNTINRSYSNRKYGIYKYKKYGTIKISKLKAIRRKEWKK